MFFNVLRLKMTYVQKESQANQPSLQKTKLKKMAVSTLHRSIKKTRQTFLIYVSNLQNRLPRTE